MHSTFSGWTVYDTLECQIVLNWLLDPKNPTNISRIRTLDFDSEHLNYNCERWKQAWDSMKVTDESRVWTGVPRDMAADVPALYKKLLGQQNSNSTHFSYELLRPANLAVLEWIDVSASAPIQELNYSFNGNTAARDTAATGQTVWRSTPFNGGYPNFNTPYMSNEVNVVLQSPGTVVVKAYYTCIPKSIQDELQTNLVLLPGENMDFGNFAAPFCIIEGTLRFPHLQQTT